MSYILALVLLLISAIPASADGVLGILANPTAGQTIYLQRLIATNTLTSTTSSQAVFPSDRDVVTLPAGVYEFACQFRFSSMSATSGNLSFDYKGAGTATIPATNLFVTSGFDAVSMSTPTAAQQAFLSGGTVTASSAATAAITTLFGLDARGLFDVSVAGTVIPSVALVTAAAAVVDVGSYCLFTQLAPTGSIKLGDVN
jgi:hypothetical protein